MINLQSLPQVVTAIGGLGTAAFGLVDATKVFGGGVNHIGFRAIKILAKSLTPCTSTNALSQSKIVATLKANWFNGKDLASQKASAKSLIKLNVNAGNAADLAGATGVDAPTLSAVATSIAAGTPLTAAQSDVYARFDLIITALLDEAYQRSDNVYRNWTRALAALIAIALAVVGGYMLNPPLALWESVLVVWWPHRWPR